MTGQIFALFILTIAAAESAIGLGYNGWFGVNPNLLSMIAYPSFTSPKELPVILDYCNILSGSIECILLIKYTDYNLNQTMYPYPSFWMIDILKNLGAVVTITINTRLQIDKHSQLSLENQFSDITDDDAIKNYTKNLILGKISGKTIN